MYLIILNVYPWTIDNAWLNLLLLTCIKYYPLGVNLGRCTGSCNILNDLSNRVSVPNKTEDLNLRIFNMITGIKH